jgi:hypothetical protein
MWHVPAGRSGIIPEAFVKHGEEKSTADNNALD